MMDKPDKKFELIREIVNKEDNVLSVTELCRIAGVSRSGYYRWVNAEDVRRAREQRDQEDFSLILQAYQFRGYAKGIRGIHMRLLHLPEPVVMNVKKIQRLMRKYGLYCPIRQANPYGGTGGSEGRAGSSPGRCGADKWPTAYTGAYQVLPTAIPAVGF